MIGFNMRGKEILKTLQLDPLLANAKDLTQWLEIMSQLNSDKHDFLDFVVICMLRHLSDKNLEDAPVQTAGISLLTLACQCHGAPTPPFCVLTICIRFAGFQLASSARSLNVASFAW